MIDQFHELLQELGNKLGITLHPDKHGACKLNINQASYVQLEYEPSHHRILIATFICEIPPGKLRENILRDGLKANFPFPEHGTLCYCERNNQLTLFSYLPFSGITGDKLAVEFHYFVEKAQKWREAVESGQTHALVGSTPKTQDANPFGLKR